MLKTGEAVRPLATFLVVAALAASFQPSHAQSPTQKPAIPPAKPAPPGVTPSATAGLCQCLYPPSLPNDAFGKTHLVFACLGAVDQCKSDCNTTVLYSFIPTAPYSCATQPAGPPGQPAPSRSS
jgi:hypothetical protein